LKADSSFHWWIEQHSNSVYVVTFPRDHTIEDLELAFADVERISAGANRHYGFIVDFGQMTHSSPRGRSIVTATEKRINEMPTVKKYCRGVAQVVRTPFQRHVLTAVNWFAKRPYDLTVVMSRSDAEEWLAARLLAPAIRNVS
jgi:hypothetical protein